MKKLRLLIVLIALAFVPAKAQDFGEIFKTGPEDASNYLEDYINPVMLSFNNGLARGWYNTAKPHKLLGFDLTISANVANIPNGDKKFLFRNSDYTNLQTESGSDVILPTIVGGSTDENLVLTPTIEINGVTFTPEDRVLAAADGIDTEDFSGLPVPSIQLGIGLIKNTDLKIRYVPPVSTEDLEFRMFGIGVLHDLKQWIPGLKLVPIDVSGFVGYTGLRAEYVIDENFTDPDFTFTADGTAVFRASSTVIQVVASKKLSILTPYVGIGYNATGSSFKVNGTFEYSDDSASTGPIKDPIDLNFDGGSSVALTAGLRIKLLILTIHADYTIQTYNTLSAGVGLSIR